MWVELALLIFNAVLTCYNIRVVYKLSNWIDLYPTSRHVAIMLPPDAVMIVKFGIGDFFEYRRVRRSLTRQQVLSTIGAGCGLSYILMAAF